MYIYDGRQTLSQWDINAKIADGNFKVGDEIHFNNTATETALVVEAYQLGDKVVANVPNELTQMTLPIKAMRYVKDGDSEYTVFEQTFSVTKRPKPADYIYTPTELVTVESEVKKALQAAKESGDFKGEKGDAYVLTKDDMDEIKAHVDEVFLGGEW